MSTDESAVASSSSSVRGPSATRVSKSDHNSCVPRAQELSEILDPVVARLVTFIGKGDADIKIHQDRAEGSSTTSSLISADSLSSRTLLDRIHNSLDLCEEGRGRDGLLEIIDDILAYSVNTTSPGFLDKLYSAPLPPGIAAELILAALNTNLHVYQVSPVLTLVEKQVTKALCGLFGFGGPRAGGISVQGGSASNLTSIVVARNSLFPMTKTHGNTAENGGKLMLFTSAHGHYSIEKAAQALGFGSQMVTSVPVDRFGRMIPTELDRLITETKQNGWTPFYINATAGTTVLGSFDPFDEISVVAKKHRCWLHVDGAWGGSFVFAKQERMKDRLRGIEKADSIAINPHKMMGVPITCSFLLTRDLRLFQSAMTLKAGYLFHGQEDEEAIDDETKESKDIVDESIDQPIETSVFDHPDDQEPWNEPYDLADMTLQCGRRGDSLKLFLCWQYYGTIGYQAKIENAYNIALHFSQIIDQSPDFQLVLGHGSEPECLQVCFHYTPDGQPVFRIENLPDADKPLQPHHRKQVARYNTLVTSSMCKALITRGFMVDFAPALEGQDEKGSFFRVVVNISTVPETMERLVKELLDIGPAVANDVRSKFQDARDQFLLREQRKGGEEEMRTSIQT